MARYFEDQLRQHLEAIAQMTKKFAQDKNYNFIILGGHEELLPKMKALLPYPLNRHLVGEFVTELNLPLNDIFLQTKKIAFNLNQKIARTEKNYFDITSKKTS